MLRLVTRASSALRRPPRFPTPAGRQYRLSSAGIKPKNTEMLLPSAPPRNEQGLRREANSATAYAARSRRPEGSHHRAQATTSRECCTMQHRRTRKSLRTDGRFVVPCLDKPDQSQCLVSRSWASVPRFSTDVCNTAPRRPSAGARHVWKATKPGFRQFSPHLSHFQEIFLSCAFAGRLS